MGLKESSCSGVHWVVRERVAAVVVVHRMMEQTFHWGFGNHWVVDFVALAASSSQCSRPSSAFGRETAEQAFALLSEK